MMANDSVKFGICALCGQHKRLLRVVTVTKCAASAKYRYCSECDVIAQERRFRNQQRDEFLRITAERRRDARDHRRRYYSNEEFRNSDLDEDPFEYYDQTVSDDFAD